MSHPCRTKTKGGDRFSRNRPFSAQGCALEASWSDTPAKKLLVQSCSSPKNFIKILSFHHKLFNFFCRTDRQTDKSRPSIYGQAKFFLCLFLIPFTSILSWRIMWFNFFDLIWFLHKQEWLECLSKIRCNENDKKITCAFLNVSRPFQAN